MSAHELLKSLAESLRESVTVEKGYGAPIEAHGKTIIPVAEIAYGLGSGYGKAKTYDKERPQRIASGERERRHYRVSLGHRRGKR